MKWGHLRGLIALAAVIALATSALAFAQSTSIGVGDPALNPNGSARLPVTFPVAGTATIQDVLTAPPLRVCGPSRRIKSLTIQIPAAGLTELRVIPVGKASQKLAAGQNVKVVALITFTPTGGTATSVKKTLKLHRTAGSAKTDSVASAACAGPLPPK
jgi:hypothetical protein